MSFNNYSEPQIQFRTNYFVILANYYVICNEKETSAKPSSSQKILFQITEPTAGKVTTAAASARMMMKAFCSSKVNNVSNGVNCGTAAMSCSPYGRPPAQPRFRHGRRQRR